MTDSELDFLVAGHHLSPAELTYVSPDPVLRGKQMRFFNAINALYFQTERTRKLRGRSWRNFLVGCGVWAFDGKAQIAAGRYQWFYGMNLKYAENERNTCAEQIAIGAATASSVTEIIGIVVIGNPRVEADGSTPPTLPPCPHCRQLMKHSELIVPSTLILTVHPPDDKTENWHEKTHQLRTFEQLLCDCGNDF
jgi:cytidine deaminase